MSMVNFPAKGNGSRVPWFKVFWVESDWESLFLNFMEFDTDIFKRLCSTPEAWQVRLFMKI